MERRTYALELAYLGTGFSGYARQPGRRTVEATLREALGRQGLGEVPLAVAGRTDAGVHARRQVVSFRVRSALDVEALRSALAREPDLRLLRAGRVDDAFHARASAKTRRYVYRLRIGGPPSPFRCVLPEGAYAWAAARAVLQAQLGTHERSPFTHRPGAPKQTTVTCASLEHIGSQRLIARFEADGYTRHLIRNWLSAALAAARGQAAPASGARGFYGSPAPAAGLCLWEVDYANDPWVGSRT